ncbi:DnaD domain protein [Desulfuribacillus alkaliarsenatis]|uniref:Uncharacterized protein n=1 Tax=Desulfuribacillus alkaliarsenatis TaxID=766136 RepID=A0A1E5FZK4_9FIRM|nr:DnaD domain protein [Desulfuribacillus alkaliarsenatis]OEF95994.1 hypothetical protein BHF68_09595 [Desulfuribacillus alkaliarsenatis]
MKRQANNIIKKIVNASWDQQLLIPGSLMKYYKKLGLNEQEAMFILQIIYYQKMENDAFPSINLLCESTTFNESQIMDLIQRLINSGYLKIDEHYDESTDMYYEAYNTQPLFDQLSDLWLKEQGWIDKLTKVYNERENKPAKSSLELVSELEELDIFSIFEGEFGRPLSPIECEKIIKWVEDDKFNKEIITEALKQAVLNGKYSMNYIDRILLEWKKRNIRSIQEIEQANLEFQNSKKKKEPKKPNTSNNYEQDKELWYWLNIESQEGR